MKACFGGSAWEWVPEVKQYYFHQFSVKQPDLNWENSKVRQEIYEMINWWIDKGIGGFRLDVIDQIAKEPDHRITCNGPKLHEFIREMSKTVFQKEDLITVGEAWGANTENAKLYSNPDGSEFSMVFQFEHIGLDQQVGKEKWDLAPLSLLSLKKRSADGRKHWMDVDGTACSGIIMICHVLCQDGAMIRNTGLNLQRCWQSCFMECRGLHTFIREKNSA